MKKEKVVGRIRCMPVRFKRSEVCEGPLNWTSWEEPLSLVALRAVQWWKQRMEYMMDAGRWR